jgi:hypothetical protein
MLGGGKGQKGSGEKKDKNGNPFVGEKTFPSLSLHALEALSNRSFLGKRLFTHKRIAVLIFFFPAPLLSLPGEMRWKNEKGCECGQ